MASKGGRSGGGGGSRSSSGGSRSSFGGGSRSSFGGGSRSSSSSPFKGSRPSAGTRPSGAGPGRTGNSPAFGSGRPSRSPGHSYRPPNRPYHPSHHGGTGHFVGGIIVGNMMGQHISRGSGDTYNNYYYGDGAEPGGYQNGNAAAPPPQKQVGYCEYCGTPYPIGETLTCPGCNSPLPQQAASAANPYAFQEQGNGGYAAPNYNNYGAGGGSYGCAQAPAKAKTSGKKIAGVVAGVVAAVVFLIVMINILDCADGRKTYNSAVGDRNTTEWFEFTVNEYEMWEDAYSRGRETYRIDDNAALIIVDVTIKNTCGEPLYILSDDFVLFLNGETEEWQEPVTDAEEYGKYFNVGGLRMFPFSYDRYDDMTYYEMAVGQTLAGRFVYTVEKPVHSALFNFVEVYEDEDSYGGVSLGDSFNVRLF